MQRSHRSLAYALVRRAARVARSTAPWRRVARLRYLGRCHARPSLPTPDLPSELQRARLAATRAYWDRRVETVQRPSGREHFWSAIVGARDYEGIARQLLSVTRLARGASVLDFGCGSGRLLAHLQRLGGIEGRGIDLSPAAIRWGQTLHGERLDLGVGDLDALASLPADSHDLCLEVGVSMYLCRASFLRLVEELLRITRRWVVLYFLHHRSEVDGWSERLLVVPAGFWLGAPGDLSCLPGLSLLSAQRLRGRARWRTADGGTLDVQLIDCAPRTLFWPWYGVCLRKR